MNTILQPSKKILIALTLSLIVSLCLVFSANAQEINPAPGTYKYGSSSELSPYATLGASSGSSSSALASTGESPIVPIAIAVSLIVGSGLLIFGALQLHRKV